MNNVASINDGSLSQNEINAIKDCHQAAVVRYGRLLMDENRYGQARQLFLDQDNFTLKARGITVDIRINNYEEARRTIGRIMSPNQSEIDYLKSQMNYVDYLDKGDQFVLTTNEYKRLESCCTLISLISSAYKEKFYKSMTCKFYMWFLKE